jgi:hypothetical protein
MGGAERIRMASNETIERSQVRRNAANFWQICDEDRSLYMRPLKSNSSAIFSWQNLGASLQAVTLQVLPSRDSAAFPLWEHRH